MRILKISLILIALTQDPALGCATVILGDEADQSTSIYDEAAVIIWDSKTQTEHFIRRVEFESGAKQIGFLVPTPTVPELVEVEPKIFDLANDISAPHIVPPKKNVGLLPAALLATVPLFDLSVLGYYRCFHYPGVSLSADSLPGEDYPVRELVKEDVAGYHATVLDADNVTQVQDWCKQKNFAWQPADAAWLGPYVKKHWKITAFQLINPQKGHFFEPRLVRLSFKTAQPFYPYSEPASSREPEYYEGSLETVRSLTVSILSDTYTTGALEEGLNWPATARYYGSTQPTTTSWDKAAWNRLAGSIENVPPYMSTYYDKSIVRAGHSDLIFSPTLFQGAYREEETDVWLQPVVQADFWDLLGGTLFFGVFSMLVYGSNRAVRLDTYAKKVPDLSQMPARSAPVREMDTVAAIVIRIFGIIFSASFFFLTYRYFAKVSNLLVYHKFIGSEPWNSYHPKSSLSGAFSASLVLLSAVLYLLLLIGASIEVNLIFPELIKDFQVLSGT